VAAALAVLLLSRKQTWRSPRVHFFALWISPALLFYVFIFVGHPGYLLLVMPPIFLVAATAIRRLSGNDLPRIAIGIALVALLLGSNCVFFFTKDLPVRTRFEHYCKDLAEVGEQLDLDKTVALCIMTTPGSGGDVLGGGVPFRHSMYYLPEAWTIYFPPDKLAASTTPGITGRPISCRRRLSVTALRISCCGMKLFLGVCLPASRPSAMTCPRISGITWCAAIPLRRSFWARTTTCNSPPLTSRMAAYAPGH